MCCVFDEAQNNQVLRGDGGALAHMRPGSVVMLMSTISPGYCKARRGSGRTEHRCDRLPAQRPATGRKDGTLSLMIGGASATVAACEDVLAPVGVVHHCGEVGAGQITKLANNAMSIGTYSLLLEIRDFVEASGLDVGSFMETLNQSTGRSFVSQNFPLRRAPGAGHAGEGRRHLSSGGGRHGPVVTDGPAVLRRRTAAAHKEGN